MSSVNYQDVHSRWSSLGKALSDQSNHTYNSRTRKFEKVERTILDRLFSGASREPPIDAINRGILELINHTEQLLREDQLNPEQADQLRQLMNVHYSQISGDEQDILKSRIDVLCNRILRKIQIKPPELKPLATLAPISEPIPLFMASASSVLEDRHYVEFLRAFEDGEKPDFIWWFTLLKGGGLSLFDSKKMIQAVNGERSEFNRQDLASRFLKNMYSLMGHQWGIDMRYALPDGKQCQTTGYFSEYMNPKFAHTFETYVEYLKTIPPEEHPPGTSLFASRQKEITEAFMDAPKYSDSNSAAHESQIADLINRYNDGKPVVIATGWKKHATTVVFYKGYAAYINRGQRKAGKQSGITIYKMSDNAFQLQEFLKVPENRKWMTEKFTRPFEEGSEFLEGTGANSLMSALRMTPVGEIPLKNQKVGNCSWANTCSALMAIGVLEQLAATGGSVSLDQAKKNVEPFYKGMTFHNRLEIMLKDFTSIHRLQASSGMPRIGDKDHFRFLSAVLYKMVNKYKEDVNAPQLREVTEEIKHHFKEYDYQIEDCVTELNKEAAEHLLSKLPKGCFVLRRSSEEGKYALSYKTGKSVRHVLISKNSDGTYSLEEKGGGIHQFSKIGDLFDDHLLTFPVIQDYSKRLPVGAINRKNYEEEFFKNKAGFMDCYLPLSIEEAKDYLMKMPVGTFLFRPSREAGNMALSVRTQSEVNNFRYQQRVDEAGNIELIGKEKTFKSIEELLVGMTTFVPQNLVLLKSLSDWIKMGLPKSGAASSAQSSPATSDHINYNWYMETLGDRWFMAVRECINDGIPLKVVLEKADIYHEMWKNSQLAVKEIFTKIKSDKQAMKLLNKMPDGTFMVYKLPGQSEEGNQFTVCYVENGTCKIEQIKGEAALKIGALLLKDPKYRYPVLIPKTVAERDWSTVYQALGESFP